MWKNCKSVDHLYHIRVFGIHENLLFMEAVTFARILRSIPLEKQIKETLRIFLRCHSSNLFFCVCIIIQRKNFKIPFNYLLWLCRKAFHRNCYIASVKGRNGNKSCLNVMKTRREEGNTSNTKLCSSVIKHETLIVHAHRFHLNEDYSAEMSSLAQQFTIKFFKIKFQWDFCGLKKKVIEKIRRELRQSTRQNFLHPAGWSINLSFFNLFLCLNSWNTFRYNLSFTWNLLDAQAPSASTTFCVKKSL